ncbi:MAG: V-type ATPase subunit [Anaerolineales bacterium]|nr:V-type ATPase subunit [Anaerolineales bacterium]
MAKSGVSGYAAISARVRAMYSSLLSPQDFARLSDAPDFPTLITQLKQTAYSPYLENLKDKDMTPQKVDLAIKGRLADSYYSVIHMAPEHARSLLKQLYRYFEVQNLKAVLRAIITDPSWERVQDVLFPMSSMTVLPAQAMLEAGSVAAAVELLQGTPYYETLSFAMKRYSAEQSLFPLEVALDLYYWRQLWQEAKKLQGQDRGQASRIIGSLMDVNNLMWVIRYRIYHQLSEEEVINYTLPFGYHVRDEDVRAIAAGADLASVVGRVFPGIPDLNALLDDPRAGLPKLEIELKRRLMQQCLAAFTGNPFHIGVPLAFLILSDLEIQDLTVLIEAKSSQMEDEEFMPYMLRQVV